MGAIEFGTANEPDPRLPEASIRPIMPWQKGLAAAAAPTAAGYAVWEAFRSHGDKRKALLLAVSSAACMAIAMREE